MQLSSPRKNHGKANKALQRGLKEFIKEDWKKVFDPENVKDQIRSIT